MIKFIVSIFVFQLIIFSASATENSEIVLEVGEFPPYLSEDMQSLGVLSEIVMQTAKDINYTARIEFVPWARAKKHMVDGYSNGSISWQPSENLNKDVIFSRYYISGDNSFFFLKNTDFVWEQFEDLKKYLLGIVYGYEFGTEFNQKRGVLNIVEIPEGQSGVKLLFKKRIDAYLNDNLVVKHEIDKYLPNNKDDFKHSKTYHVYKYYLLNLSKKRKDSEKIMRLFDAAVEKRLASGGFPSAKKWKFNIKKD